MQPLPPRSTLFPYTTLFRSHGLMTSNIAVPRCPNAAFNREIICFTSPANDRATKLQPNSIAIAQTRSEEHTSELQSRRDLVCRLLLEKKNLHYNSNLIVTPW